MIAAAFLAIHVGAPAVAQDPAPPQALRILVLDVKSDSVAAETTRAIRDEIAIELARDAVLTVSSTEDLRAAVSIESESRALGCDATSCLAEVGAALGARFIVHPVTTFPGFTVQMNAIGGGGSAGADGTGPSTSGSDGRNGGAGGGGAIGANGGGAGGFFLNGNGGNSTGSVGGGGGGGGGGAGKFRVRGASGCASLPTTQGAIECSP